MNGFDLSAFYGQFREETEENIRALTAGLLALEAQPTDRPTLDGIFRAAHTIKGSARMLGQNEAGRLSHAMETVLGQLRSHVLTMTPSLNDALLASADVLLALASRVGDPPPVDERVDPLIIWLDGFGVANPPPAPLPGAAAPLAETAVVASPSSSSAQPAAPEPAVVPAPEPAAPPPVAPAVIPEPAAAPPAASYVPSSPARPAAQPSNAARATVRVPITRLDRLLNTAGELVVGRQVTAAHGEMLGGLLARLVDQERTLRGLERDARGLRGAGSVKRDVQNRLQQLFEENEHAQADLRTAIERWTSHHASTDVLVDELEAEVMATRLQPIAGLFAPIPRAVRELARELQKEVTLVTEGETTEADRKLIEMLSDPLLHLVRNALDHGIEPAAEREALGKPREATLRLRARSLGGSIELLVSDDGRGINAGAIRQTAVRKGLIEAEVAARMRDDEALELIWQPGFSTSSFITDVSGRGVGMDVVRTAITEIGGRIEIDTALGHGTTFILTLPLTLLTTRVLLFDASGGMYALPSTACLAGRRVRSEEIETIEGRPTFAYNERTIPVVALAPLLDQRGPLPDPSQISTILILGPAQRPLGLLVNRLIDEREAVVKSLGPILSQQRLCSGSIILPDGRLVLLLNPATVAERAREVNRPAPPPAAHLQPAKLLVAEDSFTTRELLRSILQSAGYVVETAVNGRDALDKVQANTYDLVVSDVEMPHLTGFDLTRRIRGDQRLSNLPVIIITSLARESDRREGLLAGAQAYIVKSQFDQSNLLETIHQLLGR